MKTSQAKRILKVLQEANGKWVAGRYFVQDMMVSQYHARIFELQLEGYKIEPSDFKDKFGFKYYRLKKEPQQTTLFNVGGKNGILSSSLHVNCRDRGIRLN